jgi:hypothetical protein
MKGSEDMGTWKEHIDKLKSQWIGKEVVYENEKHRVVDVDYNGLLLIDKKARMTDTTAVAISNIKETDAVIAAQRQFKAIAGAR